MNPSIPTQCESILLNPGRLKKWILGSLLLGSMVHLPITPFSSQIPSHQTGWMGRGGSTWVGKKAPDSLLRKPISPSQTSGWARLPLDSQSQRTFPDLWLGNALGDSVPFEVAREGLWQPQHLSVHQLLLGKDPQGRPSVEFSLRMPEGWSLREREHLRLELRLGPGTGEPWVGKAVVARRNQGEWIRLESSQPWHLYDLGGSGRCSHLWIPWDALDYRISLESTQGTVPPLLGLQVIADTQPEAFQTDEQRPVTLEALSKQGTSGRWLLQLGETERIVGADLELQPPVAPLQPRFYRPDPEGRSEQDQFIPTTGLVWNLPALSSRRTRLALTPTLADRLVLVLPEGAKPQSLTLLIRRDTLIFPCEAGQSYFLHWGGRVKRAPGNLGALPSSRTVFASQSLSLGPAEPDPQGEALPVDPSSLTRPWLPWVAGLVVILLGLIGLRLLWPTKNKPK